MGVIIDKLYCFKRLNSFDYISAQGLWGEKVNKFNNAFNYYGLGLNSNFVVLKLNVFLSYINRYLIFCSNVIRSTGNVLFIIPCISNSKDSHFKELIMYYGLRSLQPIYLGKNAKDLLANNTVKNICLLVVFYTNLNVTFLKEALNSLVSAVYIENSGPFDKFLYSVIGNKESIFFISLCYKSVSDLVLKAMLFSLFSK